MNGLTAGGGIGGDPELSILRARRDKLLRVQEKDNLRQEVAGLEKKYGKTLSPVQARRQAEEDHMNAKFERIGIRVNRRDR